MKEVEERMSIQEVILRRAGFERYFPYQEKAMKKAAKDKVDEELLKIGLENPTDGDRTTFVILKEWLAGRPLDVMASQYGDGVYSLRNKSKMIATALSLVKTICNVDGIPYSRDFDTFVEKVKYGVPDYTLPLVKVKGFGRKIAYSLHVTMLEIAATKRFAETDPHIGITLRRLYDDRGEEELARIITQDWNVPGIGKKRVKKLIDWIKKQPPTAGGVRGELVRPARDLSRWIDL